MTKKEYKKSFVSFMDLLRNTHKGEPNCEGVECEICPLHYIVCYTDDYESKKLLTFEAMWSKTHPIVTRADKFNEVFGVDVAKVSRFCPRMIDLISAEECRLYNGHFPERERECSKCVKEFWEAEYVAPDADRSEQHDQ